MSTQPKPQPQVEATEAATTVDKLTDEAITKRIAAIGRLIHTQAGYRDDAQAEIDKLINEKAMLIEVKKIEQMRNRRNNRILAFRHQSHTLAEWAEILDIKYATLYRRLAQGLTVEDAFTSRVLNPIETAQLGASARWRKGESAICL